MWRSAGDDSLLQLPYEQTGSSCLQVLVALSIDYGHFLQLT